VDAFETAPDQVTTITPAGIEAAVRLGDVVDLEVERKRLERRLEELRADVMRAERKLANDSFVSKAPEEVVEKERRKLAEASDAKRKLESQLQGLTK
ncbi:MAG: valine--tRNA ligase, partial [Actinomycetota bacterium]|nr:valine--tRNA ligase [Actinomycetota bacterium]